MNLFDVLQAVSIGCQASDIDAGDELRDALADGLVDCIGGRLTMTAAGAAEYRCMRDARHGG
jgi:hypothetical protein